MLIDEFSHLWDGSESGWTLHYYDRIEWTISFEFGDDGPTLAELSAMRNLLDHFRNQPAKSIWENLRGKPSYTLPETLSNLEMRWLVGKADRVSLRTSVKALDRSSYLPVSPDGTAMIIEDDRLAEEVAQRMIEAGVPVQEIHID